MKLYDKEQLKHSRIFFDKQPPRFLTLFIVFTIAVFILALISSTYITKPYIVHAQGTITTSDNEYISALSDGAVFEILKKEGDNVKKGDVIFTITNGTGTPQIEGIAKQLEVVKAKSEAMSLYEQSLNENTNHLKNSGYELEYYGKMEYYLEMLRSEHTSNQQNASDLAKKVAEVNLKITQKTVLTQSLSNLDTKADTYNTKKAEIDASIEAKQSEIDAANKEVESLERQAQSSSQAYSTKLQLVSELGAAKTANQVSEADLNAQMDVYQKQNTLAKVEAQNDGFVHYLSSFKIGLSVQKGQVYAEVSENASKLMQVEAFINATDITKVKPGNPVNVSLNGVNSQKYGTLGGTIASIDKGSTLQQTNDGNIILYRCLINIDNSLLSAKDGLEIQAVKSMPVVANIVYEQETYWDWLLNLLSFKS